jgi:DNA-binding NtrC family response regulator
MRARIMKTLLLVDDEIENLRTFADILKKLGHKIIVKADGPSALSVVRGGTKIDLVITDHRMPGMDGLELLLQLKKIIPSVPVIMLTAYGAVETYLKSLSMGVFEYVNKPVRAVELRLIVKAALDSSENNDNFNDAGAQFLRP